MAMIQLLRMKALDSKTPTLQTTEEVMGLCVFLAIADTHTQRNMRRTNAKLAIKRRKSIRRTLKITMPLTSMQTE